MGEVVKMFECIYCRVAFGRQGRSDADRLPCERCMDETRLWGRAQWREFLAALTVDDARREMGELFPDE